MHGYHILHPMYLIFHILLFFCSITLYFHILKHIDYIDIEKSNNSFLIEYKNNRQLQQLCDKDKILIFDSPCDIDYNDIIYLSNTVDDETIEVPYDAFVKLLLCKSGSRYFSNITPIIRDHLKLSQFINNPFSLDKQCHLLGGPQGYSSPNYCHNFHRKFLYVSRGSIQLYLQPLTQKHIVNNDIKTLQYTIDITDDINNEIIEVGTGQIIYIPHNYIYRIVYREPMNIVYDLTSHSITSLCVNIKDIVLHKIQKNNVIINDVDIDVDVDIENIIPDPGNDVIIDVDEPGVTITETIS